MENVMSFLKELTKKAADCLLGIVKKTAAITTKLLAKGGGKALEFVGGKVNKFVTNKKQPLLLVATCVSAAAMMVSGVFYLLGRKK